MPSLAIAPILKAMKAALAQPTEANIFALADVAGLRVKSNLLGVDDIEKLDKTLVLPESASKSELRKAVVDWIRQNLKGKTLKTTDNKIVRFNSVSVDHLKYNSSRGDLKAKVIPYIVDVFSFGEFVERQELAHNRNDDFVAFHVYRKWCEVDGLNLHLEAHAGELENGTLELIAYNQKIFEKQKGLARKIESIEDTQATDLNTLSANDNKPVFDDAQVSDEYAVEDGDLVRILEVKELVNNLPSDDERLLIAKLSQDLILFNNVTVTSKNYNETTKNIRKIENTRILIEFIKSGHELSLNTYRDIISWHGHDIISPDERRQLSKYSDGGLEYILNKLEKYYQKELKKLKPKDEFNSINHHPDFVENSHGLINFGEITAQQAAIIGRQAGKIRLPMGEHRANGTGYGLVHIEAKHGAQIQGAGFISVEKFVEYVVGNFEQIWKATVGQLALMAIDKYKHVVFIQLAPATDGDYYQINTAFPVSRDYFDKKAKNGWMLLWDRSEPISKVAGQQLSVYAATPDNKSSQASPIANGQSNDILGDNSHLSNIKEKPVYDAVGDDNDVLEAQKQKAKMAIDSIPKTLEKLRLLDETPSVLSAIRLFEKNLNDLANAQTLEDYQLAFADRVLATQASNALIGGKPNSYFNDLKALKQSKQSEPKQSSNEKTSTARGFALVLSAIKSALDYPSPENLQELANRAGLGLIVKKQRKVTQEQITKYNEIAFSKGKQEADAVLLKDMVLLKYDAIDRRKIIESLQVQFLEVKKQTEAAIKKAERDAMPKIKDAVVSLLLKPELLRGKERQFLEDIKSKRVLSVKQRDWLESIAKRVGVEIKGNIQIKSSQRDSRPKLSFEDWAEDFLDVHIELMGEKEREEAYKSYKSWFDNTEDNYVNQFNSATSNNAQAILAAMRQALAVPSDANIQALAMEAGLTIKPVITNGFVKKGASRYEYIIWGVPKDGSLEEILFTQNQQGEVIATIEKAKDIKALLEDKYGVTKSRIQEVDLGGGFDFSKEIIEKANVESLNAIDLLKGDAIASIKSGQIKRGDDGKVISQAKEWMREYLAKNRPDGVFHHPQLGDVTISMGGVKDSASMMGADVHINAIPAVPYVLENSVVIEQSVDKDGEEVENFTLAAPVLIDDKRHYVVVRLKKNTSYKERPRFYIVAAELESEAQKNAALTLETRATHQEDAPLTGGKNRLLNVLHKALAVNVPPIKKYKSGSREWKKFCRDTSIKYAKLYQSYMNDKIDYDVFIKKKEKSPLSDDALKNIERVVDRSDKWRGIDVVHFDLKPEYLETKETPKYDDLGGFTFTPAIALNDTLDAIMALAKNNSQANAEKLAALIGVKLAPKQELDMFGDPIQSQGFDLFGEPIQDGEESPVEELPRLAVVELPLNKLKLSEDVPQFKSGVEDSETGVVEALGGKFDRTGVAPIQVWERADGRLEIISGRHRTDLARRSGEKTIPAQVHKESEGFTAKQAMMLDAELNIRDGQGKVKDYVDYFTHSEISEDEAERRGLIARSIGQRAFTIASKGSEELKTLHRNEIISDQAAAEIASIAPNNSAMQAVGLRVLQEHKPLNNALNTIRAVMALTREKGQEPDTFDLFGFDDSALKEAEAMARIASRKQRQIAEQLNAIKGAVKNPKLAAKHGVVVENEADALAKVQAMTAQKARWDNWSSHADLLAEVRNELNNKLDSVFDEDDYYWLCQEELVA